jgi:phenylalanyl-tRNA synthetase beta chain
VDVIEDILRIYGYNNIEIGDSLKSNLSFVFKPDTIQLQHMISEQLTAQGFNEILNNSLTKAAYYSDSSLYPSENCVKILNPLSSDLNVMRQTLLFGGLESIAYNINRKNPDLKFYEFGNCYYYLAENRKEGETLSAYSEDFHLGLWLTGQKYAQSWVASEQKSSVFELKAYIENILRRMGIKTAGLKTNLISNEFFSEGMEIMTPSKKLMATFGILKKSVLKKADIDQDVYYADLQWNIILKELKKHSIQYTELPKYPEVKRDLALLLDKNISFGEIEAIACQTEKKLLKKVSLFDVYEGKNLEAGKKSYAVSFILQDETKTLTDNQIDAVMKKLQTEFENKLGARLRS